MKITNKTGLPETFVRALKHQQKQYTGKNKGRNISVTTLLDDPHRRNLRNKYYDKIEEDVSDMIWALFGSAFHYIMEIGAGENDISEKRLEYEINGWNINGAFDLLSDNTIYDYKVTSVWSYIYKDRLEKWKQQLNIYRWLAENNGIESNSVANVLIFRDWSKSKADKNDNYPDSNTLVLKHDLMENNEIENLITENLELHEKTDTYKCSAENRWKDPDQYCVHKPLASGKGYYKRSSRNLESKEEAINWAKKNIPVDDYKIELRQSENTRCLHYCNLNKFCPFYQENIKPKLED